MSPQHVAEPGWHADPTGRHQLRYFDGSAWTFHVADNGQLQEDHHPWTQGISTAQAHDQASGTNPNRTIQILAIAGGVLFLFTAVGGPGGFLVGAFIVLWLLAWAGIIGGGLWILGGIVDFLRDVFSDSTGSHKQRTAPDKQPVADTDGGRRSATAVSPTQVNSSADPPRPYSLQFRRRWAAEFAEVESDPDYATAVRAAVESGRCNPAHLASLGAIAAEDLRRSSPAPPGLFKHIGVDGSESGQPYRCTAEDADWIATQIEDVSSNVATVEDAIAVFNVARAAAPFTNDMLGALSVTRLALAAAAPPGMTSERQLQDALVDARASGWSEEELHRVAAGSLSSPAGNASATSLLRGTAVPASQSNSRVLDGREALRLAWRALQAGDTKAAHALVEQADRQFAMSCLEPSSAGYADVAAGLAWSHVWRGVTQVLLVGPQSVSDFDLAIVAADTNGSPQVVAAARRAATETAEAMRLRGVSADAMWRRALALAAREGDQYASSLIQQDRDSEPGRYQARFFLTELDPVGDNESASTLGSKGGNALYHALAQFR